MATPIQWVDLSSIGYSKYAISSTGLIGTKATGYCTPGAKQNTGYYTTRLPNDNGKVEGVSIHILMALAFRGPRPTEEHTVDHIDMDPSNNHESNIRWATKSEQCYNRNMPGLSVYTKPITQVGLDGVEIQTWLKMKHICKEFDIDSRHIRDSIKTGSITRGYQWKYARESMPGEEWRFIEGDDFAYKVSVSNMGRVFRNGSIGFGNTGTSSRKRIGVQLSDGTNSLQHVHRLVMWAFVGPDERQVNHIDGNPKNNKLSNLEYMTPKENSQHAVDTGLRVQKTKNHRQNIAVVRMDMDGNDVQTYESVSAASRHLGIATGRISAICKGRRNYENGHKFRYLNPGGGYGHLHK